jgi:hypothetical protein
LYFGPSRFFTVSIAILRTTPGKASIREVDMRLEAKHQGPLDALDHLLQSAQEPSLDLLTRIVNGACTRISRQGKTEAFDRLVHLAKIGAWMDAAFALIELEVPLWRVRRLACENGEWLCSLSHQQNLPITFDDCAEATHEALPMAILGAFVEACRRRDATQEMVPTVPHIQPWPEQMICCENYR